MAKAIAEIRSLARGHTEAALNCLSGVMNNSPHDSARVAAAKELLDRGWGKAAQPIDGDGEGGPVQLTVTWQK